LSARLRRAEKEVTAKTYLLRWLSLATLSKPTTPSPLPALRPFGPKRRREPSRRGSA